MTVRITSTHLFFRSKRFQSIAAAVTFILMALLGLTQGASAAPPHPAPLKDPTGQSIIKTDDPKAVKAALRAAGIREVRTTPLPDGSVFITVDTLASTPAAQSFRSKLPNIEMQPNYQYHTTLTPNDPLFADQWNLPKIDAPEAWDTTTGSSGVTVAVIDTGVLFSQSWQDSTDCPLGTPCTQPDLPESRKWTNSAEQGATAQEGSAPNCTSQGLALDKSCNNIDDDSNGYIDDWQGWDFMGGWRGNSAVCPNFNSGSTYQNPTYPDYIDYDNDPQPYSCDSPTYQSELNRNHYNGTCQAYESACYVSHGTAVASVAASSGNNNYLVAGLDWGAKIMPIRVLDGYGSGSSTQIAAAVEYAADMGADVINLSLAVFSGGDCTVTDPTLESALQNAVSAGVTVVGAAGNTGTAGVCYPARSTNAVAAGATNSSDARASFSSYGPQLDVMAPGASVPAALAPNKATDYALFSLSVSGTSFSAPHVSAAASLLLSVNPTLTPAQVRNALIQNVNKVDGMNGADRTDLYGYGRINARYLVLEAQNLAYETMTYPRSLYLNVDSQKTDLLSLTEGGVAYPKGRIIAFDQKIFLGGQWYVRSSHDTQFNNHLGTPLSRLNDLPSFEPLSNPRSMVLRADLQKTDLLSESPTGPVLSKGRIIQFTTKTAYNGEWYLRSTYDTDAGNYYAIPLSQLRDVPVYTAMERPRNMKLSLATQKTNLLTLETTGTTYAAGRIIYFDTKTVVENVLYLRTAYDSDRGYHFGFPYSDLQLP